MKNVPDDWDSHYRRCARCGSTYHLSEGECLCDDECWEHDDSSAVLGEPIEPGERWRYVQNRNR
jgi:hypothetical protein